MSAAPSKRRLLTALLACSTLLHSGSVHADSEIPDPLADPLLVTHILAGDLALREGRAHEAVALLEEPADALPDAPWLQARLVRALLEAGEPHQARERLLAALRLAPRSPWLLLAASGVAERNGDREQALRHASQAAREVAREGILSRAVAMRLESLGARRIADWLRSRWLKGHLRLLVEHLESGRPMAAWTAWADRPRPLPPWLQARLATALIAAGAPERALLLAGALGRLAPETLLDAWIAGGHRARTARWLREHLPEEPDGMERAVRTWLHLGHPDEAVRMLGLAEPRACDEGLRVRAWLATGHPSEARAAALEALRTGSHLPEGAAEALLGYAVPASPEGSLASPSGPDPSASVKPPRTRHALEAPTVAPRPRIGDRRSPIAPATWSRKDRQPGEGRGNFTGAQ